jgi:hypothetical protein
MAKIGSNTKEEKSKISTEFARLRDWGYTVINFNSGKALNEYMKGFVDIVIFNQRYLVFVEVKTTSTDDKLREGQKETAIKLSSISAMNKGVHYRTIITLAEAKKLVDNILGGKL